MLLAKIDVLSGPGMHWRGLTPDWYVAAAAVACDIEDSDNRVAICIETELNDSSDNPHSRT